MKALPVATGWGWLTVGLLGACSVVNAPEDPQLEDDDAATTAAGGAATTTTSSGAGGVGGAPACTGHDQCSHLDGECSQGLCESGSCADSPLPAGASCGESTVTPCSGPDTCDGAGTCQPNHEMDGTPCDEDLCSETQVCMAGECAGGTPKDCSSLDAGCNLGVCNPNDGACETALETMCVDMDGCCPPGCTELNDSDCAKEEYTHSFTKGTLPTTSQQCLDWNMFQTQLSGSFTAVTLQGSNDLTGVTCNDPLKATQLCNALNTMTELNNVSCNGRIWNVGSCGSGPEINSRTVTGDCSCDTSYTVRPCIGNDNWGGINTTSCGAPSQTMTVICAR